MSTPSVKPNNPITGSTRGRGWAYTGAILGGLISIAANVAHSFVAPPGAPANWAPKPGAVIGSTFWPILLFIGIEILARVRWPQGFWFTVLRFGGLLPVAGIAGIVSWRHLRALLLFYGEDEIVAFLGPLAVDGLMVMATAALFAISVTKDRTDTQLAPTCEPATHSALTPATTQRDHRDPISAANTAAASARGAKATTDNLIAAARSVTANHQNRYGQPMTAQQLAQVMSVPQDTADEILAALTPAPVLNGQSNHSPTPGGHQ